MMLLYEIKDNGAYINLEDISSIEKVLGTDLYRIYMKSVRIYHQTADQVTYTISKEELEEMLDFLDYYETEE